MGNDNLVQKYARRMSFTATQQTIMDDQTFKLCAEFEKTLFIARNDRLWRYSASANPSCHLVDDWILMLGLVKANTIVQQCLAEGGDGRWRRRRRW